MTAKQAMFRIWRGDPTGGSFQDFATPVDEGMVVLDAVHRIQASQAPDLAVRWNCKAGKCGSCSAEINGVPRLIEDGVSGRLVVSGDDASLAAGLGELLAEDSLRRRLSSAAHRVVGQRYSFARRIERLARLYEEILNESPARHSRPARSRRVDSSAG